MSVVSHTSDFLDLKYDDEAMLEFTSYQHTDIHKQWASLSQAHRVLD